jgi:topoisomerase-4 subunit A
LTSEHKNSKILYFSANPNGESERVKITLSQHCKAKVKTFDFDFGELEVKGRGVKGNILTKYPVRQIKLLEKGASTLGGLKIWYDEVPGTLNKDGIGKYLGEFQAEDKIICFFKDGSYELGNFELTNRYDSQQILLLEKFDPEKIINAIYHDGNSGNDYVKRFKIETTTVGKRFPFIPSSKGSFLRAVATDDMNVEIKAKPNLLTNKDTFVYRFSEMDEVKGWRAVGKKLDEAQVESIKLWALPKPKIEIEKETDERSGESESLF